MQGSIIKQHCVGTQGLGSRTNKPTRNGTWTPSLIIPALPLTVLSLDVCPKCQKSAFWSSQQGHCLPPKLLTCLPTFTCSPLDVPKSDFGTTIGRMIFGFGFCGTNALGGQPFQQLMGGVFVFARSLCHRNTGTPAARNLAMACVTTSRNPFSVRLAKGSAQRSGQTCYSKLELCLPFLQQVLRKYGHRPRNPERARRLHVKPPGLREMAHPRTSPDIQEYPLQPGQLEEKRP